MKYNRVKKILHIIFIIFIILFVFYLLSNCIYTNAVDMNSIYNPSISDKDIINPITNQILWMVVSIGISTGVIMIAAVGLKYIVSSPEGKAELKKRAGLYFIGALLLMSGSTLVGIIATMTRKVL